MNRPSCVRSKIVATPDPTYTSRLLDDQRFDTVIIDEAAAWPWPSPFLYLAHLEGDHRRRFSATGAHCFSQDTGPNTGWPGAFTISPDHPDEIRVVPSACSTACIPTSRTSAVVATRAGLSYVSAPSTLTDRSQTAEAAPAPGHSLIFCNTEPAHPVTVRDAKGSPSTSITHCLQSVWRNRPSPRRSFAYRQHHLSLSRPGQPHRTTVAPGRTDELVRVAPSTVSRDGRATS